MTADEYSLLENFLYEAIFIPKGAERPPREMIRQEELRVYIKDFGKQKDDHCLVAECDGRYLLKSASPNFSKSH